MAGDNTQGQSLERAYNRLLLAFMAGKPQAVITQYIKEYNTLSNSTILYEDLKKDASNYIIYAQGGHMMLLHKNSPLSKKISNEGDLADESKEDRIQRRMTQNRDIRYYNDLRVKRQKIADEREIGDMQDYS